MSEPRMIVAVSIVGHILTRSEELAERVYMEQRVEGLGARRVSGNAGYRYELERARRDWPAWEAALRPSVGVEVSR